MGDVKKRFNVTGVCRPGMHYMVNLDSRLREVRLLIDAGEYFSINRARQYGKTTMLHALARYLEGDYFVLSLDFQMLSHDDFESEASFVSAFAREVLAAVGGRTGVPAEISNQLKIFADEEQKGVKLARLFACLSEWCREMSKPIVLMIDEVDTASNNQVFLDFLAQLRGYFNQRITRPTFWSVILAGVYDIRNIKQKIRKDSEHRMNSPWNIASEFDVDMSFTVEDIAGMLREYEEDHRTGMDVYSIAELIYEYTSGYPFLVSRLCRILDEGSFKSEKLRSAGNVWTEKGAREAVSLLVSEKNTLFESLSNKLEDYPKLRNVLSELLFKGKNITYSPDDEATDTAIMFGFVRVCDGNVVVANRIFETRLYNMFLAVTEMQGTEIYKAALHDRNQFVRNGQLDMKKVLERFVEHFDELYGDQDRRFYEEDGRRYFLLYLRPIINGTGNYYIESETRNMERTDVIVDYRGEQFVIELKVWRGNAYHERGEEQLMAYLEYYHLDRGYMLSFNFNKKKEIGVKELRIGEKVLIEAVV